MFPCLTKDNKRDCRTADAVLISKFLVCNPAVCKTSTNSPYVFFCQPSLRQLRSTCDSLRAVFYPVAIASWQAFWVKARSAPISVGSALRVALGPMGSTTCLASFGHHIAHVVGLGSQKQVIRTDTRGVVASMTDHHVFRDRTVQHFPHKTVCHTRGLLSGGHADGNYSIAVGVVRAVPDPTLTNDIDVLQEPFRRPCKTLANRGASTGMRAVAILASADLALRRVKRFSALLANGGDGTIGRHRNLLCGVMPSAVCSSAGAFACPQL
jgi:hypothetical protein